MCVLYFPFAPRLVNPNLIQRTLPYRARSEALCYRIDDGDEQTTKHGMQIGIVEVVK